jgi:hypothetical protein
MEMFKLLSCLKKNSCFLKENHINTDSELKVSGNKIYKMVYYLHTI